MADEELLDRRPSSASAPQLPALSPSPQQTAKLNTVTDFKTQALERQMAARERRMRAATEAPKRHAFLSSVLNQDLQQLTKWHGARPHHEQKRFVRAVDSLYKGFSKMEGALPSIQAKADKEAKAAQLRQAASIAEAQAIANQDDPYLRESPRGPPALGQSASAPNLPSNPIDVFEENKKRSRRRGGGAAGAGSDTASMASSQATRNGLEKWLDAQSNATFSTATTSATQLTTLSQMTRTSASASECSEPGTHNQMIYRVHKRALGANRRTFNAIRQDRPAYLEDGVPNIGFPECERMATAYRDEFGHKPLGGGEIHKNAYASVFQEDKLPLVEQFLESAPKDQKDSVAGMVRSLNYLRLAHHRNTSCVMRQEMNLHENQRLWKPKLQTAVAAPDQRNFSRVPLGALGLTSQKRVKDESPPPSRSGDSIYSPSVSGLGSLPLTPRSLPTPLVGGRDMPLMSAPEPLSTIAEVH
jgi:hypothetical protein